jgi:hypothetical protein
VFICLFFVVFTDYMRSIFKNQYVEWDVKTITAGDYTAEMEITPSMWKQFTEVEYPRSHHGGKTMIEVFRQFIEDIIEERLTEMPDLGYEDVAPARIEIAILSFAFNNSELINLLKERGNYIKYENYDKMREIDMKIDELKSNPENLENFTRPVSAYITMEDEEGVNRLLLYNEVCESDPHFKRYEQILGEKPSIQGASEPTDIIWENRHFTANQRNSRSCAVMLIMIVLLFISGAVIFLFSKTAAAAIQKYPIVNCK